MLSLPLNRFVFVEGEEEIVLPKIQRYSLKVTAVMGNVKTDETFTIFHILLQYNTLRY